MFFSVFAVALLAEGVDRNFFRWAESAAITSSPSSRRAWIEIGISAPFFYGYPVALLAEGVDRNHDAAAIRAL